MVYVEEDIRWDLEFDKIKDKDDLSLIMEDVWLLSDDILLSRVLELFDFRTPLSNDLNELGGQVRFEEVNGDTDDTLLRDDDALVKRIGELFDFPTPITPLSDDLMELSKDVRLGVVKGLKRKACDKDEKEEDRGGECLRRKRVCGDVKGLKRKLCDKDEQREDGGGEILRRKRVCRDGDDHQKKWNDVRELSHGEKLEKAKRKLREGYDSYSKNRKMSKVLNSKEVGLKGKLKNVVITKTTMKGNLNNKGQQCSNQNKVCRDGSRDVMVIDEKKRLNDVFKFSYAERVEMAKAKLQQGYDRCASERKNTRVISLKDVPKPAYGKKVSGFKGRHSIPVSNTIRGY